MLPLYILGTVRTPYFFTCSLVCDKKTTFASCGILLTGTTTPGSLLSGSCPSDDVARSAITRYGTTTISGRKWSEGVPATIW